jgi:hypothetical protein
MKLSIRDSSTMIIKNTRAVVAKLRPRRDHAQVAKAKATLPAIHNAAK